MFSVACFFTVNEHYDKGYNIVAYQRGDGKEMAGAYTESKRPEPIQKVKGSSGYYQKQDAVRPDKDYSYKIRFTSSDGGKTRDLVFLDILENAWNVDGNQSEGWQGCFKGVQYRLPANQGIDVKILYSTAQGLN